MGGGRTAEGVAIYKRVNGKYIRQAPYKKQKEKSFSDKVDEATTKLELFEVLKGKYERKWIRRDVVFKNDFELVKKVVKTVDELESRYPFMKGYVKGLGITEKGVAEFYDGILKLNPTYWDRDNDHLHTEPTSTYHPPNMTPEGMIAHEFGHAIQEYLMNKKLEATEGHLIEEYEFWEKLRAGEALDDVEAIALKSLGMSVDEARGGISEYAKAPRSKFKATKQSSMYESFAEAFADVFTNGDKASKESKAYVNALISEAEKFGR